MADKSMVFKIGARDDASSVFTRVAAAATTLGSKLDDLDKKHVKPRVTLDSEAARTRASELGEALKELRNQRVRVDVDLGSGRADVGDLRRELSYLRDVKVKVRVDTAAGAGDMAALGAQLASFRDAQAVVRLDTDQALARAATLRARLDELSDVKVKVEVESGDARAELTAIARAARRLNGVDGTTIRVKIEVDAGNSVAELTAIAALVREVRGTTRHRVIVQTGQSAAAVAEVASAADALAESLATAAKAAAAGIAIPGILGTLGLIGSLGGAAQDLVGVLGLIPGSAAMAGATIGTLVVGLQGFGEALEARDDAEKFAEAIGKLSPAARDAAVTVRDLGGAWDGVRLDVQERLFAGLGDTIEQVSRNYLPTMTAGLGGIATELNTGARSFADWATQGRTVVDVNTILGNTRTTLRELAPAGVNVAAALTDIAVVGSDIMPELASGATAASASFRQFVAEARQTGQLEQWIRGGISTLEQLGRIAINTGGVLGSIFQASETAGYDFLDAVEQITGELDNLLSSAQGQNALVELLRESRDVINATLPGARDLAGAILDTTAAAAKSDGLERFAELLSQAGSAVSPLVAQLGPLATDTLGNLSSGASLAVSAVTPLISVLAAVTDGLGPIPGLVLASVIAFKGLGLATTSVVALGTALQVASIQAAAMTGAVTGSAGAALLAGRSTLALGTAVTALGRNLPLIGVALVAAGFAIDQFTADFDGATQKVLSGSQSMSQAIAEQAAIIDANHIAWLGGLDAQGAYAAAQQEVTARVEEQIAAMGPLEAAQARATLAQTAYGDKVREFGPNSQQARDASADLAAATDDVAAAQLAAERAAMTYSDRLREQASAAQTALGANLQLEDALRRVADAETAANEAAAAHGEGSQEAAAAYTEFVAAADQAAQSAQRVAEANAAGLGPQAAADAGTAAYGATLLQVAANAEGPARNAILGHIAALSDSALEALSAGAAASGFATQLLQLPDGRTVTIAVDPETGEIISTQQLIENMPDGSVAISLETQAALDSLGSLVGIVNGASGSVNIDGNPQAAGVALQTVLQAIAQGQGTVTINGQAVPAASALQTIIGQIAQSGATVTINGQAVPAAQVLNDTLGAIGRGQGTVTINGQSLPARGVLEAIIGTVSRSNGQMTISARDLATAVLNAIPKSSTHTVTIRTVGRVAVNPQGGLREYHDGGIFPGRSFHDGGVQPAVALAAGAQIPRRFTAGTAQRFPPGILRFTGDRTDVDEYYIPDNNAPRSLSLGAQWARRRGMDLVPKARRSVMAARAGASSTVPRSLSALTPVGTGGDARSAMAQGIRDAVTQVRIAVGTGGAPDLGPLLREFSGLRAELRDAVGMTVNQTLISSDPTEGGRQSVYALQSARRK